MTDDPNASTLQWVWRNFVDQTSRKSLKLLCFWQTCAKVSDLCYPWALGAGVAALSTHDELTAFRALCAIALAGIIRIFCGWHIIRNAERLENAIATTTDHVINTAFFAKNLGLHIAEHELLSEGSMSKGRDRVMSLGHTLAFELPEVVIAVAVILATLLVTNPMCLAIVLVTVTLGTIITRHFNTQVIAEADENDKTYRAYNRHRMERIHSVQRVVMSNRADAEIGRMHKKLDAIGKENARIWVRYSTGVIPREILNLVGLFFVTLYAGNETLAGRMTIAELVSMMTWTSIVTSQIRMFARLERDVVWCLASITSLRKALTLPTEVTEIPNPIVLNDDEPLTVTFQNVTHRYRNNPPVLRNVSFTIAAGETVALLGPSGAGKSTLTQLLQRYMDPTEGTIFVNGHDLKTIDLAWWRKKIAVIAQSPSILDGTLRENLLYAIDDAVQATITDAQLWEVMRQYRIDFGARLTDGLNTRVGKGGQQISGGEAQRIIIGAAALEVKYQGARIMVIDEATSSLDAESQNAVHEALSILRQSGVSALSIAHRLSAVADSDAFVVLTPACAERPQIEATAPTMAQLAERSPTFKHLAMLERVNVSS